MRRALSRCVMLAIAAGVLAFTASIASADGPGWTTIAQFQGPVFGLNVGHGDELLVADSGAGPTKLDPDDAETALIGELPNVTDVIQIGRRDYLAVTGEGEPGTGAAALYRIKNGTVSMIADLHAFEEENDPAEDGVESNPFDLAKWRGGKAFVADAAGNSILVVDKNGNVDWVASLPQHDVPTAPLKELVGCPTPPIPELEEVCGLPEIMNADPVATTVAVGPDGAIYAGELTGDPGTPGFSRVWRIEADARQVKCLEDNDEDDDCTLVDTPPFTSIIDIQFGEDGTAYVVEFDENSWLSIFFGLSAGGTVNACRANGDDDDDGENDTVSWSCEEVATGLPTPTAVALDDGSIYVTLINELQGPFEVAVLSDGDEDGEDGDND